MGIRDMLGGEDDGKLLGGCFDLSSPGDAAGLDGSLDGFDFGIDFGLDGRDLAAASPAELGGGLEVMPSQTAGAVASSPLDGHGDPAASGGMQHATQEQHHFNQAHHQAAALERAHAQQQHEATAASMAQAGRAGMLGSHSDALLSLGLDSFDPHALGADLGLGLGGAGGLALGMAGAGGRGSYSASLAGLAASGNLTPATAAALQQQRAARLLRLRRAQQQQQRSRLAAAAAAANGFMGGAGFRGGMAELGAAGLLDDDLMLEESMLMGAAGAGLGGYPGLSGVAGMRQGPASHGSLGRPSAGAGGLTSNQAALQRHFLRGNLLAQQRLMMGAAGLRGQLGGLQRRTSAPSNLVANALDQYGAYPGATHGYHNHMGRSMSAAGGLDLGEEGAALSSKTGGRSAGAMQAGDDATSYPPPPQGVEASNVAAAAAAAAATAAANSAGQASAGEATAKVPEAAAAAAAAASGSAGAGGAAAAAPPAVVGTKRRASAIAAAAALNSSRASEGSPDDDKDDDEDDEEAGDSGPGASGGKSGNGAGGSAGTAAGGSAGAAGGAPAPKRKKKSQNEKIEELKVQVLELREQNQSLKKKAGKLASDKSKILTCLTNLSMLVGQKKVENEMLKSKIQQLQEVVCGEDPGAAQMGVKPQDESPSSEQSHQQHVAPPQQQQQQQLRSDELHQTQEGQLDLTMLRQVLRGLG